MAYVYAHRWLGCCAVVFFSCFTLQALDNSHFYRASFFTGEPRFEKRWLQTLGVTCSGGSTRTARNACGKKVCLDNPEILQKLLACPIGIPRDLQIEIDGRFGIFEAIIDWYSNYTCGFFTHFYLPIRSLEITDISCGRRRVLARNPYDQHVLNVRKSGLGDVSLLGGWTINYEQTECLDFIDFAVQVGLLLPTGVERSERKLLDIPLGYDGHFGIPILFDSAIGFYDWLTLGLHGDVLIFIDRFKHIKKVGRCALDACERAHVQRRPLGAIECYIKADHVVQGLSWLLGYRYDHKGHDLWRSCKKRLPVCCPGWRMHTLNVIAEYDFAHLDRPCAPRIGLIYNAAVGGRNIFTTSILGGYIYFDIG